MGHLQTAISQARSKILTNFHRLKSTTMLLLLLMLTYFFYHFVIKRLQSTTKHGHMVCVQKSDMGMTKKRGKSTKIRSTFKLQYLKLETSFWHTFKGYNQLLDMDIWCVKISDMGMTKNEAKVPKLGAPSNCNISS